MAWLPQSISILIIAHTLSSPTFAGCDDSEHAAVIDYVPTVITAPASLVLSGAGYIVDGTIYIGSAVVVSGIVCIGPFLLINGVYQSATILTPFYDECAKSVLGATKDELPFPELGRKIYQGTKQWRCPVTF